eukprot:363280-Chlamydomonas_euryale.AAC.7
MASGKAGRSCGSQMTQGVDKDGADAFRQGAHQQPRAMSRVLCMGRWWGVVLRAAQCLPAGYVCPCLLAAWVCVLYI